MHHTVEDEPGRRDQAGQLAFGAKARVVAIDRIIWIQRCSSSCSAAARPGNRSPVISGSAQSRWPPGRSRPRAWLRIAPVAGPLCTSRLRLPCRPEEVDGHPDDKRRQIRLRLCRAASAAAWRHFRVPPLVNRRRGQPDPRLPPGLLPAASPATPATRWPAPTYGLRPSSSFGTYRPDNEGRDSRPARSGDEDAQRMA